MPDELHPNLLYVTDPPAVEFTAAEAQALAEVNRHVVSGDSLDEVMSLVFRVTSGIFPCDRLGVAFAEEDGQRLVSYWTQAHYAPIILGNGYAEDVRGSSLQPLLEQRTLRIINDLAAYHREHPHSRSCRLLLEEGVRSSLTCPLYVEGRPVALLFRSSRQPQAYGLRELALHQALAERLGQAVDKAHKLEQLRKLNHSYIELLGFVSHELKSPLAALVSSGTLLLDGYVGELAPPQQERVRRMVTKAQYLLGTIREYLDLARLEDGSLGLRCRTDVDLVREVLEPALDLVAESLTAKGQTVVREFPPETATVQADPGMLKIVLVNLLSNAAKYGFAQAVVRVRFVRTEDQFVVSVWNAGPGFPKTELGKLFRKFSRLDTPELRKEKGTGVGLYNCWRIAQLHGGHVQARAEPGQWAEFTLTIPQPVPVVAAGPGPATSG